MTLRYVTMAVPEDLYTEVIAVIHRHFTGETTPAASGGAAAEGGLMPVPGQGEWSVAMLRTVKEACPYDAPLKAIEMAASNPGRMTFYDDIVEASGLPRPVFQARMGAFSKFTKKSFGRKTWPFEWGFVGDRLFYRMTKRVADAWHALEA